MLSFVTPKVVALHLGAKMYGKKHMCYASESTYRCMEELR
jgi:hypothetical protein